MIDLAQFKVGVDIWEGDDDPDFSRLKADGVDFVIMRMNQSNGSLIFDKQFHNWPAAAGLSRGAYVVISPFITRQKYTEWLCNNLPTDCRLVALDVEIQGTTAAELGALVAGVAADIKMTGRNVLIYSGYWCYNWLNPWPRQFDQWWARYPGNLHPYPYQAITWAQMREKLAALPGYDPLDGYTIQPGHVAVWQITSSYILPGGPASWPIDVNLMPQDDYLMLFGVKAPTLEQRVAELEHRVADLERRVLDTGR